MRQTFRSKIDRTAQLCEDEILDKIFEQESILMDLKETKDILMVFLICSRRRK